VTAPVIATVIATLLQLVPPQFTPLQAVEVFPVIVVEGVAATPANLSPRSVVRRAEEALEDPIPVRSNFRRRLLSSARQL